MSGDLKFYDDVQQRAINLLLTTFKEKEKFPALISGLTKSFQELEDVFKDLYTQRSLDGAYGQQLDNLGQIPVQDRLGLNDEDYRNAIKFKILENQSYGGMETIIEAIKFFTGSETVINIEVYPAAIQAYCDGLTEYSQVPKNFVKNIDDLCGGGIKFMFIAMGYGDFPFAFSWIDKNDDVITDPRGGTYAWIDGDDELVIDGAGIYTWALQQ